MATAMEFQERIEAFARQLSEEMGEIDASNGVDWLDALENQAIKITNAVHAELIKQKSNEYPIQDDESVCPGCNKQGRYQESRERKMLTQRGPAIVGEPKYFCPCCRKDFFPVDQRDRC